MLVKLDIKIILDGYGIDNSNCNIVPLSFATGLFNAQNYYYYNLLWAAEMNWGNSESSEWFDRSLLCYLGLDVRTISVKDDKNIIRIIQNEIDMGRPVFIFVRYNKVFFSVVYETDLQLVHPMVVSGYDAEKHIFIINECTLKNDTRAYTLKGDPMLELRITEDMLSEIYHKSNTSFSDHEHLHNRIFSMYSNKKSQINSYSDLANRFLDSYKADNSNLKHIFEESINVYKDENIASSMRRRFFGSIVMLLDIFSRIEPYDDSLSTEFALFKKKYIEHRNLLISRIQANALREKIFTRENIENIHKEIDVMDKDLFIFIKRIAHSSKENSLINYALGCDVTSDSIYVSNGYASDAKNIVNGKWDSPNDRWLSGNNDKHWLCVDLGGRRDVRKFVVRHEINPTLRTVSFSIQGSNNLTEWDILADVIDNLEMITIHNISMAKYRYFRLFITQSSRIDNYARLYEFEIWGE